MPFTPIDDREILRPLAEKVMSLALSDGYDRRRARWRDANAGRRSDRPPVWCGMAGVSRELFPPESLECRDGAARSIESSLRRALYKDWVGDDEVFPPWYEVGAVWRSDPEDPFGLRTHVSLGSTAEGGFSYFHPVEREEDFDRIAVPRFTLDQAATASRLERARELLGDAMPVRLACQPPLLPHHSVYLEQLRGMEPMLNDLAFRPELVHRAMARITEGVLGALRAAEETGLLTPNNELPMTCSDPVGERIAAPAPAGALAAWAREARPARLSNLWCAANSQEFQVVSPAMQEEFLLAYQIPCLQQFGAVQYGCCEDLTHKIRIVRRIPNLRVFVCSYWTRLDKLLDACGTAYTYMWRQLSAHVMVPEDLASYARELEAGLRLLRGHSCQVVLREVESLHGHRDRLKEWADLTIRTVERVWR
jgi:hypothetical protein